MTEYSRHKESIDWWNSGTDLESANRLVACYQKLRQDNVPRLELMQRHMRMYGMSATGMPKVALNLPDDRLRLNVIKAASDTVVAKITKNKPKPKPLTTGGNWSLRKKAKMLERFFDAQFYISGVSKASPKVFLDAVVMGTGVFKVYEEDKKILVERIFPGELFVDTMDGLYGDPRMIVQRKYVDRAVLMKMFPKHKEQILYAKPLDTDHIEDVGYTEDCDQITVLEAWRRPSTSGAKDGKHIIAIDGATLLLEGWDRGLPFVFIRWSEPIRGFWGVGLAEELTGIQAEINRLLQKIQAAFHLVSVPRVFVEEGSKVMSAKLNNRLGMIVPYRGTKPIYEVPASTHPEMREHLWMLYNKAFEIAGVSTMSSGGTKPAGLESGIALRTFHDIETERFATVARSWEQLHLDIALQMVSVAKRIGGSFATQSGKYSLQQIEWKDIDMDRDAYILQVFPASALPSTPAGRLAAVEQMINAQLFGPETAKELLDYPDLDKQMALDRAARDNIDRILEKILDEGQFETPEPYMDLQLAIVVAQSTYNMALEYEDIPEERLNMLRNFMRLCHRMLKAAMAEQQAMTATPAPGAPPPVGPAGAPPTAVTSNQQVMM
jgi:hypothetical protein